ncbi:unnamed protein product [Peniophora sp. CBMAI 1063]|nr:unnamed protein product [Peniophora sp. CBMAI 1063]
MSSSMQDPHSPTTTRFTAQFLVIGGGVSGLATSVALRRAGHEVTVLERELSLDQGEASHSGYRMPPNMTKIFYDWGLEGELETVGVDSGCFHVIRLADGATLTLYQKDEELMREVGGVTMSVDRRNLRRVLSSKARALGAQIRMGADVVSVAEDGKSVRLRSGEEIQSDVIIGAGGTNDLIRRTLLEETPDFGRDTDLVLFDAVLSLAAIRDTPALKELLDAQPDAEHVWFGDRHAAILFPISSETAAFHLYAPRLNPQGKGTSDIADFDPTGMEPRVLKLVSMMKPTTTSLHIVEFDPLEDWVHPSSRCVTIGQGAHPFVLGSLQGPAMGVEDAAAFAELFSHLRGEDQIPTFLSAFQEIRRTRCQEICDVDSRNLQEMTRPNSEITRARDLAMQTLYQAGTPLYELRTLDDAQKRWADTWGTYSYNAEDVANEWWHSWGRPQLLLTNPQSIKFDTLDISAFIHDTSPLTILMTSAMFKLCRASRPTNAIRSSTTVARRRMATTASGPTRSSAASKYVLLGTAAASAYTLGALYPVDLFTFISPRVAPPPPPPDHPDAIALVERLEKEINELPALRELRTRFDSAEWYESRPYATLREERRVNNLTAGALRGAGRLAVPPVCWARKNESEAYVFIHVGRGLCGHDGIIHGGLIATLLDETLARTAILNLPEKIGVTANLSINYRAPTKADQFIVIKTRLVELKGRKASVSGVVQDLSGNTLAEAAGIFVQPRYAKLLSAEALHEAMGHPKGHAKDAAKEEASVV